MDTSTNGDEKLTVEFYSDAVQSTVQSEEKGYPVFVDKTLCRIIIPGDTLQIVVKEANDQLKRRFPRQWAAYEQGQAQVTEGFPLEQWPVITKSQVEALKFLQFRTVEQLADSSDSQLQRVGMGAYELRTKAQAFIKSAKDGAIVQKQAAENERLNQRIADLEAQIAQIGTETIKRGRKAKDDTITDHAGGIQ